VAPAAVAPREVRIYSHNYLVYWWPVWVVGFLMALLTYLQGEKVTFQTRPLLPHVSSSEAPQTRTVKMHPSHNLGVIYTFVVLLVILLTNVPVRGMASVAVIIGLFALVLFFAYMEWWDAILHALGSLAIYMNLGFYVFFSSAIFLIWALTVFVFDRMDYWVFQPGQLIHVTWLGGGQQTFDTRGMSVTKERSSLFRHWILGLGSGDLHISATGARQAEFTLPNVMFVGARLAQIERLVALKPDDVQRNVFTAGEPS
jgi:hypothetical protein